MKVFVYGTLKKGFGNHRLLSEFPLEKEGILEDHIIYDAGFPVAVPNEGTKVVGEVYDIGDCVQTLQNLDYLEGEGRMYIRTKVTLNDGEEVETYIGPDSFWDFKAMKTFKDLGDGTYEYPHR